MNRFNLSIKRFMTAECNPDTPNSSGTLHMQIKWTFLSLLIFGMLAHGYAFFNAIHTHDSLNALYADAAESAWKISLGRFLVPLYQTCIRGRFAVPWLIGILSLLWVGLSAFLIIRMFSIHTPICIVLISGICATNLTYTLTAATYIHDLDINMLALLFAALAAYQWHSHRHISISGILCITAVLGLYQSFVSVCIVLIILRCMLDLLLKNDTLPRIIYKGILGCVMLLLGAVLYVLILKALQYCGVYTPSTGMGNSIGNLSTLSLSSIFYGALSSYRHFVIQLHTGWNSIFPEWFVTASHVLLAAAASALLLVSIIGRSISLTGIMLSALLALLIPPAVFFTSILSRYESLHLLMLYSIWLLYFGILLIAYSVPVSSSSRIARPARLIIALLMMILIWGNIRTANTLYLIKDMQYDGAKALMTRVLYRAEDHDDYVAGQTPIAMIGASQLLAQVPNAERYEALVGVPYNLIERAPEASYDSQYKLIAYSLGSPVRLCDDDTYRRLKDSDEVRQMPSYPADGCMQMIDGTFVIKLGS